MRASASQPYAVFCLSASALAKPLLPVAFFFAGVTYDTITLSRIGRLIDNLVLLLNLSLLGLLIILTGRVELAGTGPSPAVPGPPGRSDRSRTGSRTSGSWSASLRWCASVSSPYSCRC